MKTPWLNSALFLSRTVTCIQRGILVVSVGLGGSQSCNIDTGITLPRK